MNKLLLTDEDLMVILHCDQDTILEMVSWGIPHYYHNNHFYFSYPEIQESLIEFMELGYIETQYQEVRQYLESVLNDELDLDNLKEQLKSYMKSSKGLADERFVWLYNNIGGNKYVAFYEYVKAFFPKVKSKNIFKYYIAFLKTLLDTGIYKDNINLTQD